MIQPRPSTAPISSVPQPVKAERLGTPSTVWDVALVAFGVVLERAAEADLPSQDGLPLLKALVGIGAAKEQIAVGVPAQRGAGSAGSTAR